MVAHSTSGRPVTLTPDILIEIHRELTASKCDRIAPVRVCPASHMCGPCRSRVPVLMRKSGFLLFCGAKCYGRRRARLHSVPSRDKFSACAHKCTCSSSSLCRLPDFVCVAYNRSSASATFIPIGPTLLRENRNYVPVAPFELMRRDWSVRTHTSRHVFIALTTALNENLQHNKQNNDPIRFPCLGLPISMQPRRQHNVRKSMQVYNVPADDAKSDWFMSHRYKNASWHGWHDVFLWLFV